MSRWIELEPLIADLDKGLWGKDYDKALAEAIIQDAPSIDLDDYVPKDFHDKTCEAMAKRHQEEIADMVSVVRCKECKNYLNDHICTHWSGYYGTIEMLADDFCSYGQKGDENVETD